MVSWRALSVVVLVLGSVVAGPSLAEARPVLAADEPEESSTSTTWALRPAAQEGPDGRVSLRHVVEGGAGATDLVALTNFSDRPATFAVYASDGTVTSDGSFDVLASDQAPVDGGAWITIPAQDGATAREDGVVVEVAAGATALLPVQISVPANATPGDHPAGIVAELVHAGDGTVQLSSRVGVRVHLRVAGDIVAALAPEDVTAMYTPSWNPFAGGTVTVRFAVANAGNVRLGAGAVASLAGPGGAAPRQARSEEREVLPGQATVTTVEVPVAPLFFAWGDVVVTPTVVGEDDVDVTLTPATASFTVWTVPWSQLALLVLVLGALLLARASRRRSAARVQAKIDAAVAAATGKVPAAEGPAQEEVAEDEPVKSEQAVDARAQ